MANPQRENGYTAVANEILDNIVQCKLNGTQFRIIMTVWRYTYGFNRKEYGISETFLSKAIGIARHNINREIKILFENKILITVKKATFSEAAIIMFNKNYDEWQQVSNRTTGIENDNTYQKDTFGSIESDTSTGIESDTQERNIKENIKKDEHILFFDTVWQLYPYKKGKTAVSAKAKKELHKAGYDLIAASIENYTAQKPEWQEYMYGSTFFNGRWREYAESEPQEHTESINNDGWNY